jgi:hypothetical protein
MIFKEKNVEEQIAEKQQKDAGRPEFEVIVIYNGLSKSIAVKDDETIKQVLERAIEANSPLPNPHTLSLFTEKGEELADDSTVKASHLHPHQKLLLRPSQVKGG